MDVAALVENQYLGLKLLTATQPTGLRKSISGVASTELIDPSGYLEGGELVALTGIAMNVQDDLTWDAYVERLVRVPISGIVFNSGLAHAQVPIALIRACNTFDVPLFEVSPPANLMQLHRFVSDTLRAENHAILRSSLDLSDRCAQMEMQGTDLMELMAEISRTVRGDVSLLDAQGRQVASHRSEHHIDSQSEADDADNKNYDVVQSVGPIRGGDRFFLAVRCVERVHSLETLLGPASAIVGLHLNAAAAGMNIQSERMRTLS